MDNQAFQLLQEALRDIKKDFKENLSEIKGELSDMKGTLEENHDSWVEHMKRAELNETHIQRVEEYIKALEQRFNTTINSIEPHIKKYDNFLTVLKIAPIIFLAGSAATFIFLWTTLPENTKTLLIGLIKSLL